jgi:hypothetical protein
MMTFNTMIPALRRRIAPRRSAFTPSGNQPLSSQPAISPLTREQTRLAVMEVLG